MSRKDYEAIAHTIRTITDQVGADPQDVAKRLADLFEASNERFDRGRFLRACRA